jgi:hypothetical protein
VLARILKWGLIAKLLGWVRERRARRQHRTED